VTEKKDFKILFLGDIVGRPGRRAVADLLPKIRKERGVNLVIANGENLAAGFGMTFSKYEEMSRAGVDVFTSGNHIWDKVEFIPYLNDEKTYVARPANYPESAPGRGVIELTVDGEKITIVNLIGRVFMKDEVEDPFTWGKGIAEKAAGSLIFVDFHAEATSEKIALANYLDGFVSAVVGTHTHVQTADERILGKGTAFITDAGMCGAYDSVIGMDKEIIIEKFLTQLSKSHKVASGDSIFNAVLVSIDRETKKAITVERISCVYPV
jgi:hypothetical protein